MRLSILTTITNPEIRQDQYIEALNNYSAFADEVIVVNGGNKIGFNGNVNELLMIWPYEWNWLELPKHLNFGIENCTGDWIIKLDIDQLIHENDFETLRVYLENIPSEYDTASLQKMTMLYNKKYYQKGGQVVCFRNKKYIRVGKNTDNNTDLCFPIIVDGYEEDDVYRLPVGSTPNNMRLPTSYWNYDYFFKTKMLTKTEFFRFSRAYNRYFNEWKFGDTEEKSFNIFLNNMKSRYIHAPYMYNVESHSKYIREKVRNLTEEQFGFNAWGLL